MTGDERTGERATGANRTEGDSMTDDTTQRTDGTDDSEETEREDGTASGDDPIARLAAAVRGIDYRRVASTLGSVVAVLAVIPFVVYAAPGAVGADASYVVLSGSMEPTISPGDVIVVESVDPADIEEGDVITFRREGDVRPTTHRVIEVREEGGEPAFRTAGDANEAPDQEPVRASQVDGRVATVGGTPFVIPYVGHVIQFASTGLGFTLLFATPLVLFVGTELRDIVLDSRTADDGDDGDDGGGESGGASAEASDAGDGAETDPGDTADDAPDDAADENDADEDAGVTVSATELGLGVAILGAFLGYSLWVAYVTVTVWAFAVAASVGTAFLMFASLYLFGGGSGEAEEDEGAADAGDAGDEGGTTDDSAADDEDDADHPDLLSIEDPFDDPFDDSATSAEWDVDVEPRDEIVFGADGRDDELEGASDD